MGKQRKAIARLNCVLLFVVILVVVMVFIFKSTVTNIEPNQGIEDAVMAKEQNYVTTPSAIVSQSSISSSCALSYNIATSSSISDKDEKKKQEQKRRKKLREQRRKKRLEQKKKRERYKKILEQRKTANVYNYTREELMTLSKIIWEEARGEPYIGKVAVGAVAMNRLETKSSEFGAENGKLLEVLLKKWAFAEITISDEEFISSEYYEDCVKAAKAAFAGEDPTKEYFENGALFFYDVTIDISPRQMKYREGIDIYRIGNHAFHITLND